MMGKASGIFGIKVGEPQWVEVKSPKPVDYINAIKSDINPANTKIVVVIIGNPSDKKDIKGFLDKGGVPSQFILANKMRNAKIGVFSNLLKQMNAKLKLDLYRVNLPHFKNTMLLGVDVIMNGRNKLVGCCATVTPSLSQCLTKLYKQKPPTFTPEERKVLRGKTLKEEQERRIT
jgi:argonaute-like protein implicated in RNA metabolism and viral defense